MTKRAQRRRRQAVIEQGNWKLDGRKMTCICGAERHIPAWAAICIEPQRADNGFERHVICLECKRVHTILGGKRKATNYLEKPSPSRVMKRRWFEVLRSHLPVIAQSDLESEAVKQLQEGNIVVMRCLVIDGQNEIVLGVITPGD